MNNEQNEQFQSDAGSSFESPQNEGREGMAEKAKRLANDAQHRAGDQVESTLQTGKQKAARALNDVAQTLLQSTDENDSGADSGTDRYIHRAGEQIQRVSDYLQNTDLRDMVAQTERFARRQPALFLGSAFAVGILAARFMKSSRRAEDRRWDGGPDFRRSGDEPLYDRERPVASYNETTQGSHGDALDSRSGMTEGSGLGGVSGYQGMGTSGGMGATGTGTSGDAGRTGTPGGAGVGGSGTGGGATAGGGIGSTGSTGSTGFADAQRSGTDALSPGSSTGPLGTTEGDRR